MAIIALIIRNSQWAEEKKLKSYSAEMLAFAVHDHPNDPLVFLYYGSALLKKNDAQDALFAFQRAVKLRPSLARGWLGIGSIQLRLQNYSASQISFQKAVKLRPQSITAYLGLAQAYYLAGLALHAEEPLRKIVQLQPHNAAAWYFLGRMYGDTHESDRALDAMQHASKYDPKNPDIWRDLGELNLHYAHYPEAEKDFMNALHLNRSDANSYYLLGHLYSLEGDTPALRGQAEQALLDAIARNPNLEDAYFELGQLYERHGEYTLAAANYRKARSLSLSDAQALYHLGLCLIHLNQTAEGNNLIAGAQALSKAQRDIDYMQKRVISEPNNRDLRLRLARLYVHYQDFPNALMQYEAYASLGPYNAQVEKEAKVCYAALKKQNQQSAPSLPSTSGIPQ